MPETIEQALAYLKRLHKLLTLGINEGQTDTILLAKMLAQHQLYPDNDYIQAVIINEAREWYQVVGEDTTKYEFNME